MSGSCQFATQWLFVRGKGMGVSHWHYNDCLQGADQIEEGFRRASYNAKTVRKLIRNLFMDSTGPLAAAFSIYVRVLLRRGTCSWNVDAPPGRRPIRHQTGVK